MSLNTMIFVSITVILIMIGLLFYPKPEWNQLNRETAERHIKLDKVRLLTFGMGGRFGAEVRVAVKYGFVEWNMGCIVGYSKDEKEYDKIVRDYLNKRNGVGWENKYYQEIDSVRNVLGFN